MGSRAFARYGWIVLGYSLPVILFGAFVSSSLSGDGCGMSWPLCHGAILPDGSAKSAIEYAHRASSGLFMLMVLAQVVWAFRLFPRGHGVRRSTFTVAVFTLLEAAIGAKLVLRGWVAMDASTERVLMSGVHLMNTFVLLAALTMVVWYSSGQPRPRWRGQGAIGWALGLAVSGMMVLGVTGSLASLGVLIYPSNGLVDGMRQDLDPDSPLLQQIRLLHPLTAVSVGLFMVCLASLVAVRRPSPLVRGSARWVGGLFLAQLVVGFSNLLMSAPVWMQIVHLAVSNLIWISLVFMVAAALTTTAVSVRAQDAPEAAEAVREHVGYMALVRDYVELTKPRVISLLLFTTVAAMFIAAQGWPGGWLILAVTLGGYMAAGAANTFNMIVEKDLDVAMERTAKRPTVGHRVSDRNAFLFGLTLAVGSFALLWSAANVLAAVMALSGLLFYVFVYTLLLKRRTWQNIVIGGAAGAFPPLVGYAAVTGSLSPLAWFLFCLIFTWTPVHFWALAILIKDEYAKAGVPMLPVVHGDRVTVLQITVYTFLTVILCGAPILLGQAGMVYLAGAALLNLGLVARTLALLFHTERPQARSLFKYSMVYLALMFVVIALDRTWILL